MSKGTRREHYTEVFSSRHFGYTVEVWCPQLDETKTVLGHRYIRNCPMCGGEVEVEKP